MTSKHALYVLYYLYLPNFKLKSIDCKCNMGNLTANMEKNQEHNRWKEKAKGVGNRSF